ncbi:MarR family protein [Paenibacillus sp. CF095]|uniref:MarR family winged helix-turn-helix transcriptional regulator n=1 Tax=Paenibacillus TaxID=44249 RepID=UPI00088458D9|nr:MULTISPECIES: MarR family winged helix-turn-helix transcriptional regulator [Paenibacillus]TDL68051.1 MarR family transcriptional regulator [Paenibacillus amylolyticus]UOK65442.1 MarR family winged helix-turn-helix transcriptional regulator [Paenibacillus sp. OVF10]WJM10165.1 MarR family winged helix-turn-helix transcriptional regulator [Paenibacillus sp. PK1-4R]SDC86441.1 MarR family protein [Paenibacillus sp. CF095]
MKLDWMGDHRELIEKIIKYGNAYSNTYKLQRSYGTDMMFSASQIQTLEYILEAEDKEEKMSEMAARLGVSRSTFSKNVKNLTEKGLLEKFHLSGNRKDIYVKPSPKGREVYAKYTEFVRELCFDEIFKYADQISEVDKQNFVRIMDLFADVLVWYGEKEQEARKLIRIDSDSGSD